MLKGLYVLDTKAFEGIYPPSVRSQIESRVEMHPLNLTRETIRDNYDLLEEADLIFSGWGGVAMDDVFLEHAPRLKAVFYGAGTVKSIVSDAFWERNIVITSGYAANAVPVAEYTLSQILFALKGGWQFARIIKEAGAYPRSVYSMFHEIPGGYGSTVGIISLGMIGRLVCQFLRSFDVNIIAYDPYVSREEAAGLSIELCPLDALFRRADVVSCHAPRLPQTEGMLTGRHFASMKKWATFINTARGAVVREPELIEVLRRRPDLQAVLDVTFPEPPEQGSPLYTLPNVVLTPHIAGSKTPGEKSRLGNCMVEELKRFLNGEPLRWQITKEKASIMA